MKKIVVMLLAFLFLFAGCKTKKNDDTDKNDTNNNIPEPTQQSPQQTPEASIMDSRVQAGSEKNVWILANDTVESMSQSQMQLFSDELLMRKNAVQYSRWFRYQAARRQLKGK